MNMDITKLPIKKTALNPLWIISIFFSFTEIVLGLAVFNTQGGIQIALTTFVIAFPIFIATMFFIILWNRPKHLYAPTDYQSDKSFLDSFNPIETANNLIQQIEETVKNIFNSEKVIQELKGGRKTEDVLHETAETVVKKIIEDNFITIDITKFNKNKEEVLTFVYDDFRTLSDLTNRVYFKLSSITDISAYAYGYEWVLRVERNDSIVKNARMITGIPQGEPLIDKRTLEEVGIMRGDKLIVEKPILSAKPLF
jgi:hypothetical protein